MPPIDGRSFNSSEKCLSLLREFQLEVQRAGLNDAQYQSLPDHPHLAADRFLAYLSRALNDAETQVEARQEWLLRSFQLAEEKRNIEYGNLVRHPTKPSAKWKNLQQTLQSCAQILLDDDLQHAASHTSLPQFEIGDSYSSWKRAMGLYFISRWFVAGGVERLHQNTRTVQTRKSTLENTVTFSLAQTKNDSPVLSATELAALLQQGRQNSLLGVPDLNSQQLDLLFRHYAPDWRIEQSSKADQPGAITLTNEDEIRVDHSHPLLYTLPSYTVWHSGEILLQLNYFIWFSERPRQQTIDLYGGFLDGLIWRITLAPDGQALMYDSIHQCGCYYQVFPLRKELILKDADAGEEPVLSTFLTPPTQHKKLTIKLSSGEHFIQSVNFDHSVGEVHHYQLQHYQQLKKVPYQYKGRDAQRSLFQSNGIIAGTERAERWLLWPMGVASPGAMRQWGHHAIAFIGRRHFDEPTLFTELFHLQSTQSAIPSAPLSPIH